MNKEQENLREKFKEETNDKLWAEDFTKDVGFSDKYVEWLEQQLLIQRVSFCLPVENETFEQWFDKHFNHLGNTMVECKNQATIKYNETEIVELYSFLTDRLLAN